MRKLLSIAVLAVALMSLLAACDNYETYGDKKDKERKAIRNFISLRGIKHISEDQFREQGYTTDTAANEFVYLNNSGVYMQIVRKGSGTPLQNNENSDLIVRFLEVGLLDSISLYNDTAPYDYDVMNVRRSGATYTASFTKGLMKSTYGESVPSGWLVPFNYINVGRDGHTADEEVAKVKLIVPHTQGHSIASSYVYPYYYEISFERIIDL